MRPFFHLSFFSWTSCRHSFFQRFWVNFSRPVAAIHSFKGLFFYYKRAVTDMYSFKFSVFFFQNNCSRKISEFPVMISAWLQGCIYSDACLEPSRTSMVELFWEKFKKLHHRWSSTGFSILLWEKNLCSKNMQQIYRKTPMP